MDSKVIIGALVLKLKTKKFSSLFIKVDMEVFKEGSSKQSFNLIRFAEVDEVIYKEAKVYGRFVRDKGCSKNTRSNGKGSKTN